MKATRRFLTALLLTIIVAPLTSCEAGNEIVGVEVIQLPYRLIYIAGVDDSLDMEGCVIRLHNRNGRTTDIAFGSWSFVSMVYRINFLIPGEYEVFFYWRDNRIHTMTIQVIAPD